MKRGGNAVDAALAMNAAMGFLEPTGCGIGGDLFALVWHEKSGKLFGLNASGRSCYGLTVESVRKLGHGAIPHRGPLAVTVPGCISGWQALLDRFGTWTLADIVQPAIELAREGAPVPRTIARAWGASVERVLQSDDARRTFLPEGRSPREGGVFRNPWLAKTLSVVAEEGPDAFYRGVLASKMVASLRSAGGFHDLADFRDHLATWVEPVSSSYRGVEVWQIPPNGQGIATLQILNLLEHFDVAAMGQGSPDYWHAFLEAKKLAYADRARYYADPEFGEVPVETLISKAYAKSRVGGIGEAAQNQVLAGDLDIRQSDTVYMTVVDGERNAVSLIQSNYMGFGSGVMAGDLGFMFQNRGLAFSLDASHPNRLEPHKRPFHTIIPGFATRDGQPWLCFGVMGGDMQPQGQAQILVNLLDFGLDVQAAGDALRLEHVGSATPEGGQAKGGGLVIPEPGESKTLLTDLRRRGHRIGKPMVNGGGYQAIQIDFERGVLAGASESRRDGQAVGF
jgi:gamma-glutamyltranspeptidase/glutathione hydrolase